MGLFDTFYFKNYKIKRNVLPKNLGELSLEEIQEAEYQTKDLGQTYTGYFYLEKHKNSNRLFKHDIEYTWIEGDKKAKHWMDSLGHMEEKSSQEILVENIGTTTVKVYNYFPKENYDYWVEFSLIFLENKLSKIELSEFREEKNDERKVRDYELKEKMRKIHEFNQTFHGKFLNICRKVYYKTVYKIQKFVGKILINMGNAIMYWRLL